jgi:hypothetical protein
MNITNSLWVKDIEEGKLLRPADDTDKKNLDMETKEEFEQSAHNLTQRIFLNYLPKS